MAGDEQSLPAPKSSTEPRVRVAAASRVCRYGIRSLKIACGRVCVFVLALSGLSSVSSFGQGEHAFEYQGNLSKTIGSFTNSPTNIDFTWYSAPNGEWRVDIVERYEDSQSSRMITNNIVSAYNGKDVYTLNSSNEMMPVDGITTGTNVLPPYTAKIGPGETHIGEGFWTYLLWFVFEGGRKLEGDLIKQLPNLNAGPGTVKGYVFDATISRSPENRNQIVEAVWKVNPEYLSYDDLVYHPDVIIPISDDSARFDRSIVDSIRENLWREVDSIFRVLEFAENEEMSYPSRFEILEFPWYPSAPDGTFNSKVSGVVNQMAKVSIRTSVLPEFRGQASVWDLRFHFKDKATETGSRGIKYNISDGNWITNTNSAQLQSLVRIPTHTRPLGDPTPKKKPYLLIVVFCVLLAGPAFAVLYRRRHRVAAK